MPLIQLNISNVRNLSQVTLEPRTAGFNFIYGDNGSGKTSLLEAIHYLSYGKSFRSHITERVIHREKNKLSIFAQILSDTSAMAIPVGLERTREGNIQLRMNGENVPSIADFANLLPVQVIDSHCHQLLDAGPIYRRKYLDWGIFYSNKDFLRLWRQYERALKQRNAALRGQIPFKALEAWTNELVESGVQFHQIRCQYMDILMPYLKPLISELLDISELRMHYYPGWDESKTYRDVLLQSWEKDLHFGFTQYGPHKADLKILIYRTPARDILSRGQQKLFVCAMMLARGALLQHYVKKPIYLVDDLPSELDITSRSNLLTLLARQDAQIFVTATEHKNCEMFKPNSPMKLFHVEQGCVREVYV